MKEKSDGNILDEEVLQTGNLSLMELTSLVVGSIIGGGIFDLMQNMAAVPAGAGAILIAWIIAGIGMIFLALSFKNLSMKRQDLDAGIYSYAEEGFGKYMGFNSAWGYWASAWLGDVGYATLLMSSVGYFLPIFGNGQNIWSIVAASAILWLCHFLLLRGAESASFINTVVTIAKLVPIFLFIIVMIVAFKLNVFTSGFWLTPSGHFQFSDVMKQVRGTMLVTVWVFIGVEGAVVFSGKAKKREDIGRATVLGIITVILIYMLVTLLSLGVMKQSQVASLSQPAMAALLEHVIGKTGAIIVNLGLIVSVAGAWLSWTMFASQVPYEAAKNGTFPSFFAKENKYHAPVNSLIITNVLTELFILTFLFTSSAYQLFYTISTAAILIPYMFSAFYQLKYTMHEDPQTPGHTGNFIVGIIASIYTVWLVYSAGTTNLLLLMILFAVGIPVYIYLQKHDNHAKKVFGPVELCFAILFVILGILAIFLLLTHKITISGS